MRKMSLITANILNEKSKYPINVMLNDYFHHIDEVFSNKKILLLENQFRDKYEKKYADILFLFVLKNKLYIKTQSKHEIRKFCETSVSYAYFTLYDYISEKSPNSNDVILSAIWLYGQWQFDSAYDAFRQSVTHDWITVMIRIMQCAWGNVKNNRNNKTYLFNKLNKILQKNKLDKKTSQHLNDAVRVAFLCHQYFKKELIRHAKPRMITFANSYMESYLYSKHKELDFTLSMAKKNKLPTLRNYRKMRVDSGGVPAIFMFQFIIVANDQISLKNLYKSKMTGLLTNLVGDLVCLENDIFSLPSDIEQHETNIVNVLSGANKKISLGSYLKVIKIISENYAKFCKLKLSSQLSPDELFLIKFTINVCFGATIWHTYEKRYARGCQLLRIVLTSPNMNQKKFSQCLHTVGRGF